MWYNTSFFSFFRIYCHKLCDISSAEDYCDRIFRFSTCEADKAVYLSLMRTLIRPPDDSSLLLLPTSSSTSNAHTNNNPNSTHNNNTTSSNSYNNSLLLLAIDIAERNYDRIEPLAFLEIIPKNAPLNLIAKYLNLVIEVTNSKKRNLQVIHQLLRVREVNIRTNNA